MVTDPSNLILKNRHIQQKVTLLNKSQLNKKIYPIEKFE